MNQQTDNHIPLDIFSLAFYRISIQVILHFLSYFIHSKEMLAYSPRTATVYNSKLLDKCAELAQWLHVNTVLKQDLSLPCKIQMLMLGSLKRAPGTLIPSSGFLGYLCSHLYSCIQRYIHVTNTLCFFFCGGRGFLGSFVITNRIKQITVRGGNSQKWQCEVP